MTDFEDRCEIASMQITDKLGYLSFDEAVSETLADLTVLKAPDAEKLVAGAAQYLVLSIGLGE